MHFNLKSVLAASVVTGALIMGGCSGNDGANGTNGRDLTSQVKVSELTPEQWADLKPQVDPASVSVSIASPPVVRFKVTDANGNPVVGLGATSKSSTATVPSYSNISFTLAKLVPGTSGSPSKWVSYIVTTVPTTTAPAVTATRPTSDNTGTLVDNGDGTYKYTFYRDVTKVKDVVAGLTLTAPNNAADLGDLTYNPNLTHRLAIQISGNAPGTGSNTSNGVQSVPGVALKTPANIIYDFIPATGRAVSATDAKRDIAMNAGCMDCHTKFTFHGGARQDVRYCVVCHTDQRKFGRTEATAAGDNFTSTTYRVNDLSMGDLPTMVHKIHMGEELTKTNYDYAGVKFNEITYSQPVKNCTKCHAQDASTPQGNNWKTVPSRLACGACHDNVDFAAGTNHTGGRASTDANCVLCHDAAAIEEYHQSVDPVGSEGRGGFPLNTAQDVPTVGYAQGQGPGIPLVSLKNPPADVFKMGLEIKSVSVAGAAGAKKATIVYRVLKNGAPVTFSAAGGTTLMADVDGTPSLYVSYAVPNYQNIAAPTDWTTGFNATVLNVRNGVGGTQTGPDADGYYTATLNNIVPDNATMVTGALGINYQGFRQTNLTRYPNGIRLREPAFAMKTATGYTARRTVVDNAKCNKCHDQLGVMPSFHSGARNNGAGCGLASCHQGNKPTGHVGAANNFGGGWSVSAKDLIHGIHGSGKRTQDFSYEATVSNPKGFGAVTYPNLAQNCEACHVAGSYDFRNSQSLVSGLLWSVMADANMTNAGAVTPIGQSPWIYNTMSPNASGEADYSAANNNLVTSPVAAACFGCHDDSLAVSHMRANGGKIYEPRGLNLSGGVFVNNEQCLICHGPGKSADIKNVHMNF